MFPLRLKRFMICDAVADYHTLCGECPVWDPDARTLFWTDCTGQKFFRFHWDTARHEVLKEGLEILGFRRNLSGGFVITNTSGAWLWDGADQLDLLAADAEGSRCQLNDCAADSRGRLLAGSFFYDPGAEYEFGRLIRIDTNGEASVLDEGFHLSKA